MSLVKQNLRGRINVFASPPRLTPQACFDGILTNFSFISYPHISSLSSGFVFH